MTLLSTGAIAADVPSVIGTWTVIYSSAKTAGTGRVQGNEMETCRTDAPCAVLTRSK
jgi:hypothetical protein